MTDTPPDDPPRRRPGRPATRQDGRAMTAAERQERRRARFVDREPAVAALVELALATRELDDLLTERGGPAADPELHRRHRAIVDTQESLAVTLGMPSAWPHRRATYIRFQRAGKLPPDPPGRTSR